MSRAYIMSNRGELICLDVQGQANGNDGPFMDEGALATSPRQPGQQPRKDAEGIVQPEPLLVDKRDGRILAREDEGIAPNIFHNTLSS